MCGIAGFLDFSKRSNQDVLLSMTSTLNHRGPDDEGYLFRARDSYHLGLGHKRLTIIDLSEKGRQPMDFEHLSITFNGEIYNYKEIKKELQSLGYTFNSDSDTEVVLKSFHRWGSDCLHKFHGMFAFAIWDDKEEKLLLFRDRMGVKPLYWYNADGIFIFGSELKPFFKNELFQKDLSTKGLTLFLHYGYITSPFTIFENTYKLEPGHLLTIDKNGKITDEEYWSLKEHFLKGSEEKDKWLRRSEEEVLEELEGILHKSFNYRMVADVPVGVFLSGGVDSSLVAALLQKDSTQALNTFTIGFEEDFYNEAPWAKKVADHLGTKHTELFCSPREAFDIIQQLPELYDEPFGDSSAIPTHLVSRLAKDHVKVALSADGGDEQFCGYKRFLYMANIESKKESYPYLDYVIKLVSEDKVSDLLDLVDRKLRGQNKNFLKDKLKKLSSMSDKSDLFARYDLIYNFYLPDEMLKVGMPNDHNQLFKFNKDLEKLDVLAKCMYYDLNTYLIDDILCKVDRATMGVSLEGREPFLDQDILEYSSRIPSELKYKGKVPKYLLKKILEKYVPREYFDRPKQGFAVPIQEWFSNDLSRLYDQYLDENLLKSDGIFDAAYVNQTRRDFEKGKGVYPYKLWFIFVFQMWKEKYL